MKRSYLPVEFKITTWESLKPFFEELVSRKIDSSEELYTWYLNRSELESAVSEDMGWRYIKMTCDTTNEEIKDAFNYFVSEIQPAIAPFSNQLDTKALEDPFLSELTGKEGFDIVIKLLQRINKYTEKKTFHCFPRLNRWLISLGVFQLR